MVGCVATDGYGFFGATDKCIVELYAALAGLIAVVPFLLRRKFYRIRTCLCVCEISPWVLISRRKSTMDMAGKRMTLEMYRVSRKPPPPPISMRSTSHRDPNLE
jgi:hypothetical protein